MGVWLGLGVLWAVILLCHQFSGVVATAGAAATAVAARPGRAVWPRLGAALLLGVAVLGAWPYYDFFALADAGDRLEAVHRVLYDHPAARYGLALLGVAALVPRWRRDHLDPLVLFCALGVLIVAVGRITGHYSWARALPAALIPAQLAAALAVVEAGARRVRAVWAALLAGALLAGAWAQAGALGYVVPADALPGPVVEKYRRPWPGYGWITRWVRYGDVVMAEGRIARQVPAYGPYTVAPATPTSSSPASNAARPPRRRTSPRARPRRSGGVSSGSTRCGGYWTAAARWTTPPCGRWREGRAGRCCTRCGEAAGGSRGGSGWGGRPVLGLVVP